MTLSTLHPLASDYLARLRAATRGLPEDRRRDLLADIESHLAEAVAPDASDAEALNVLERLGDPAEIVAAEAPAPVPADPRGTREWAAIILLLVGGIAAGIGWVVGLICLWSSRAWTTRDKWIGTLVIPGGLATSLGVLLLAVGSGASGGGACPQPASGAPAVACSTGGGGPGVAAIILMLVLVAAPVCTAVYLAHRARA